MKKTLLSLTVAAFAFAVQAGDAKKEKDSKDQPACCAGKAGLTLARDVPSITPTTLPSVIALNVFVRAR